MITKYAEICWNLGRHSSHGPHMQLNRNTYQGIDKQGKGQRLIKSNTALGAAIAYFWTLSALFYARVVFQWDPILIINGSQVWGRLLQAYFSIDYALNATSYFQLHASHAPFSELFWSHPGIAGMQFWVATFRRLPLSYFTGQRIRISTNFRCRGPVSISVSTEHLI